MELGGLPDWMAYASIPRLMREKGASNISYGREKVEPLPESKGYFNIQNFTRYTFQNGFVVEDINKLMEEVEMKAYNDTEAKYRMQNGKIPRIKALRAIGDMNPSGSSAYIGLKEGKEFVEAYWPSGGNEPVKNIKGEN